MGELAPIYSKREEFPREEGTPSEEGHTTCERIGSQV
jgi:hypothetical protein